MVDAGMEHELKDLGDDERMNFDANMVRKIVG